MKKFSLQKIFLASFIVILLSACGGSSSNSKSTTDTTKQSTTTPISYVVNPVIPDEQNNESSDTSSNTSGIAVDPYIKNATFFWDKNKNGIRDLDEPISSLSDENGKFTFDEKIQSGERIIMKDKGEHNGVPYTGDLSANLGENGVVSPLTTIEVIYPNSYANMLQTLGIKEEDIHKDPMSSENKTVELTTATVAIDTFLKIEKLDGVVVNQTTLSDIVTATKKVLGSDISDENIKNLVKVADRLIVKIKKDENFAELNKLKDDENYAKNIKTTLSSLSSMEASYIDELNSDGTGFTYDSKLLDDRIFSFSSAPVKNSEVTLTLNLDDIIGTQIQWNIKEDPSSSLVINKSSDQKSITFTPSEVGLYTIEVVSTAISNNAISKKTISFNVVEVLTMGTQGVSIDTNSSKQIGTVLNQSWISSKSLNESSLEALLPAGITKVGYSKSNGLLVQYDANSSVIKELLEKLKLESGIDKIFNRVYYNDNAYDNNVIYPKDNGNFNDGGSNWHLEVINMPEAWEYTTGSDKFMVGVSDGGFDTNHDDLSGKFASILTSKKSDHGMAVTGTMVANTNNAIGISGINWKSQAVVSYMGGSYVEDIITSKKDGKEVRLVNNSWGYHLPTSFDPTNNSIAQQRFDDMQDIYAQIRQMVTYYDNKLFLWAAGNGIGNGIGNSDGIYGVDAKYDNGVLHYKDGALSKLDNLLVVGAFIQNKTLVYYSEYGQSVDIAAPTHFDSLALNNGIYTSFGGTSAATPVVSAVASLIYSINPNLTASEVKNILIDSATEYITQRQIDPSGTLEYLVHPIPMLNAKSALAMAKETVKQKVMVKTRIIDIFNPKIELTYTPSNKKYEVVGIQIDVKSSNTQSNYSNISNNTVNSSNKIQAILDPNKMHHKIDALITLKYLATGDTFTQEHSFLYAYSDLTIKTIDNITLTPIPNVNVQISKLDSNMSISNGTSDLNGILKIYVDEGTFRLKGSIASYSNATKDIAIPNDVSINTDLALTPTSIEKQGSIAGFVYDENGIALQNALVRISGGVYTNGYFASSNTDINGYYKLTSISKNASKDFNNTKIEDFTMSVSKNGYVQVIKNDVIVLENQERMENFNLIKEIEIPTDEYIYKTDFESDVSDWNSTGFWHQINLKNSDITNIFVDLNRTILAPDDDELGKLPKAYSGENVFWYGEDSTGSFEGNSSNTGTLTSPLITLPLDINTTLKFNTWWEIESVNPNADGFDLLQVYIIFDDYNSSQMCSNEIWTSKYKNKLFSMQNMAWNSQWDTMLNKKFNIACGSNEGILLKKLNPEIDPPSNKNESYEEALSKREKLPFSSAGFNRKATWNTEEFDLSEYAGKNIRLKFVFDTKDGLYNEFRGWMIDDLKIFDSSNINK